MISPQIRTIPVVATVSQATLLIGSCAKHASRIASEIVSQTLSGCPSVTDSDVKVRLLTKFLLKKIRWRRPCGFVQNTNPLLFDRPGTGLSLRWAPTCSIDCLRGVAVASQVLCTSTTLNKRTIYSFVNYLIFSYRYDIIAPLEFSVNYNFSHNLCDLTHCFVLFEISLFYFYKNTMYTHT